MNKPRAHTPEEGRKMLLDHFRMLAKYWSDLQKQGKGDDTHMGLVFSILASLDGDSLELPAFAILAQPHPEDKKYDIAQGENYWKPNTDVTCGYPLHEFWHE